VTFVKTGVRSIGGLIVAAILGALLAALADTVTGGMLVGTPLGPEAQSSVVLWTVIGGLVIYGLQEAGS
jgi:hypothetical protein